MPIMIWIAIIIEAGIQSWPDMGVLLGIQFLNASISFYETTKAGDAVAALKVRGRVVSWLACPLFRIDPSFNRSSTGPCPTRPDPLTDPHPIHPPTNRPRSSPWRTSSATASSSRWTPRCWCLATSCSSARAAPFRPTASSTTAQIDVDQAALTGESLPVTMFKGDSCKMGSTVVRGEVEATVEATGANTFFGRTASLLRARTEHSNLEKLLMRIMIVLVVLSMALCGIAFGYLLGRGEKVREALSFTVVLLVASIPIAIEIVCTTTLALGSRELSQDGAIVSRLAAIEDMAGVWCVRAGLVGWLVVS